MLGIRLHLPLFDTTDLPGWTAMTVGVLGRRIISQNMFFGNVGGGRWNPCLIRSFKNPLLFSDTTDISLLQESTYPNYQTIQPIMHPGSPLAGTQTVGYFSTRDFAPQVIGDPAGELLAGIYLTDNPGGSLLAGASLDRPIALVDGLLIPVFFLVT